MSLPEQTLTFDEAELDISFTAVDGAPSIEELRVICALVRKHRPKRLFEFGTFRGQTTLNMLRNAPEGASIVTLDLLPFGQRGGLPTANDSVFTEDEKGAQFVGVPSIRQLFGDSATIGLAEFAGTMEFIFIDGCHSYEYCMNDSLRALAMATNNAMILWHDYSAGWPGVVAALDDLHAASISFTSLSRIKNTSLALLKVEGKQP